MQSLAALQELAELAASYSAAAREADAALGWLRSTRCCGAHCEQALVGELGGLALWAGLGLGSSVRWNDGKEARMTGE